MTRAAPPSAEQALRRLLEGNARFVRGEAHAAPPPHASLAELAQGQHPFATILGCSDSRVPPEWVFDAGLGELFVIRVAGNVLAPEVAGSIQYAVAHLKTPLMMVLGHEGCGAVEAALATRVGGVKHRARIQRLVDDILPGLAGIDLRRKPAERLSEAVEQNVRATVRAIRESPEGRVRAADPSVRLVGAVYEIATGRVRLLDEAGAARDASEPTRPSRGGPMDTQRIFTMPFATVYPLYVQKAERKGRTQAEVDAVIGWLTGYTPKALAQLVQSKSDLATFFRQAPAPHPHAAKVTGVICGVRIEDLDDPLMQDIRRMDKLVDELAKGRPMEKILRP